MPHTAPTETIDRIDAWIVPVPLRRPHVMSFGAVADATQVVVRLTTAGGAQGWGETTILGGPFWNEESAESARAAIARYLGPRLIGVSVDDARAIDGVLTSLRRNHFAVSALDMALHDVRARLRGISVAALLGGATETRLPLSWSLANGDLAADLDELDEKLDAGHRIFKIKTGSLPVADDVRRVQAVVDRVGDRASVRIDANQGWSRAEAGRALRALDDCGLAFIEQPLVKADIDGLARLQAVTATPIAADESLETLAEAQRLIAADAARVFVLKLAKHAGFRTGLSVADLARGTGIETYLGCMIESSIGTAASLALAAAAPPLAHGCELFGPSLLADDLVETPISNADGSVALPAGPGLGVTVDAAKVARLAVSHDELR